MVCHTKIDNVCFVCIYSFLSCGGIVAVICGHACACCNDDHLIEAFVKVDGCACRMIEGRYNDRFTHNRYLGGGLGGGSHLDPALTVNVRVARGNESCVSILCTCRIWNEYGCFFLRIVSDLDNDVGDACGLKCGRYHVLVGIGLYVDNDSLSAKGV